MLTFVLIWCQVITIVVMSELDSQLSLFLGNWHNYSPSHELSWHNMPSYMMHHVIHLPSRLVGLTSFTWILSILTILCSHLSLFGHKMSLLGLAKLLFNKVSCVHLYKLFSTLFRSFIFSAHWFHLHLFLCTWVVIVSSSKTYWCLHQQSFSALVAMYHFNATCNLV